MARLLALAFSSLGLLLAAAASAAQDECAGEQCSLAGLADTHAMQVSATEGAGMQADAALDRSLLLKVAGHQASDGAGPVSRVVETLRKAFTNHHAAGKAEGAREQEAPKDSARPVADANATEAARAQAAPEEARAQPKETAAAAVESPPEADDAKPQETARHAAPEAVGTGPQEGTQEAARADASQQARHQSDAQPEESSGADGRTSNERVAVDRANAFGDPHLQNIRMEKFEIRKQGEFDMLTIPRGVAADEALLQVVAGVKALDGKCGGMYIQRLTLTGRWMERLPPLHFSTGTDLFNAPETRGLEVGGSGNLSAEEFSSMVPASMVKLVPATTNVRAPVAANKHVTTMVASLSVGPKVVLKVSWVAEKRKLFPGFANGLWLSVNNLNNANASIGGLLGFDDHSGASTSPPECGAGLEDRFGQTRAGEDDSMMLGVGRRSLGAQALAAAQLGARREEIVVMAAAALGSEDNVTDSLFQAAPATTIQAKPEDVLRAAFGAEQDMLRHAFDSKEVTNVAMQTVGKKSALHDASRTPKEFALLKRAFKSIAASGDD